MNPLLERLNPYPFEKLKALLASVILPKDLPEINLTIGEPQHAVPEFVPKILAENYTKLSKYPVTAGNDRFKKSCTDWLFNRYHIAVNANEEILAVNGTREALFSFVQASIDAQNKEAYVVVPNPFYQIYEGAALLAGAKVAYANCNAPSFNPNWSEIPESIWEKTQLVFVCSPGNPTGAVLTLEDWQELFQMQQKCDFIIASDECYSEIYAHQKPLGILEAANLLKLDYSKKIMFTSLSKRSNLPGLRSGFVAGDASLISNFLKYRTYHGSAMSDLTQEISIAAWQDEKHVALNRQLYEEKFTKVMAVLQQKFEVTKPDASFYLWLRVPDAVDFTVNLYAKKAVKVLPGTYLARETSFGNPGQNYVRIALVAAVAECVEAAQRMINL